MTQQHKREAIEKKVREVCGLNKPTSFEELFKPKEIHLEHLLRTLTRTKVKNMVNDLIVRVFGAGVPVAIINPVMCAEGEPYDLTKSFSENLENDELTDFLYSLICE